MPDIDLTKDYNLLGQRVNLGGVYSDFWVYPFGLPNRAIVYEEGFVPLSFDGIKYIRDNNTETPGELPTTEKTFHVYATTDLQPVIGSDPVFAIHWRQVPNSSPARFEVGYKFREYDSMNDDDYGHWNASGGFNYHYFNDGYTGVDPSNVTGADHWRQQITFVYFSNIDGYGLPQNYMDRFGFVLQHYKQHVVNAGDPYVSDGYTFPAYNEFGVPLDELDPSYPGEHRVFSYGSFFNESTDGRANAFMSIRGVYALFMGQFVTVESDTPDDWFDLDDDETPELPEPGEYDPNGYDGTNDPDFPLPTKSVLSSGLFQLFIPSTAELQAFARYLWSNDYESSLERYGMKPMDNIVNFGIIPFDLREEKGNAVELELCGQATGIQLTSAQRAYHKKSLGNIYIDPKALTGSHLDYDANFNLYLPCIGFVKLRGAEIIGKSVNIQYRIDISTGDCIAYVNVNTPTTNYLCYAYTGNCMFKLPLTSADFASYYQRERQGVLGMFASGASAIGSAIAGGAIGGPLGAVGGALLSGAQSVNSMWDAMEGLKMNQPEVQRGGSFTGSLAYLGYKIPYIIVDYPHPYRKGYNKFYSYPTMRSMQLKECKGLTQVARVRLDNLNATSAEKDMIRALLKDGVFINSSI